MFAVSYGDGSLKVYNSLKGNMVVQILESFMKSEKSPKRIMGKDETASMVTGISWRPPLN